MADLANYSFIPWLRQGLATKITEKDTLGASGTGLDIAEERAKLQVDLTVQDTSIEDDSLNDTVISKQVQVIGPGDVIGISDRAIVRTNPKARINNFEANSLVYIDFYEEDFAWRYTPANPNTTNINARRRLRPWLVLVVLKEEEFEIQKNPDGLPTLILNESAVDQVFPDHNETWAWAHVQINKALDNSGGPNLVNEVNTTLDQDPDTGISRLISPRKLTKSTAYSAFLLPAFETGRLVGLGESITGVKAQEPSWRKNTDGTVTLSGTRPGAFPVYFQWQFHTGQFGDFESLVSILKPIVMENNSGKMPMDIQSPGFGLEGKAGTETLGMEGALKPLEGESDPWPDATEDNDFINRLRKILNLNVDLSDEAVVPSDLADNPFYEAPAVDDPILVPPSYGLHHAMIKKLGLGTNPQWIEQLNINPTLRAAAGLGTKTVQDKQEDLMHRAWQQVGEVNDANQKIREAELAKMVSRSLFSKHILSATNDKGLARTAAFHRVILNSDRSKSVESQFAETRIPLAAKSAAFKRILRPGKKANKKINQMSLEGKILQKDLLQNFNKDEGTTDVVIAAALKIIPDNALSIGSLNTAIDTAISSYTEDDNNMAQETFFRTIRQANLDTLNRTTLRNTMNALTDPSPSAAVKTITDGLITAIINSSYSKNAASGFIEMEIDPVVYKDVFGAASTVKFYENVKVGRPLDTDENEQIASATSSKDLQEFKTDFTDFSTGAGQLKTPELLPLIQNLGNFYSNITHKINPAFTIDRKITRRIKVWDGQKLVPLPKLKPIMAHPEFPEPVYEYLGKISQNFILPNIDQLPNNSLTLLISNQKFIEAYMAGLNHEMARELLWREYPTDQRGSYFRQFWNIKDNIFDDDNSKLLDIKKVHEWRGELGTHSARDKAANLVLVVRGELMNKYPNTMVYAQTAVYDAADPSEARVLPETITPGNTKFPLFSAELEPDIMLYGFDLEAEEAKGDRVPQGSTNTSGLKPGWFFVFKERPGQITFGLDDFTDDQGNEVMPGQNGTPVLPESWNDLAWEHLVDQREELEEFQISFSKNFTVVDPGDGNPHPSWGTNSADLASILFQNPVLFARHAAEMLP